jgi:hypothetical protein
MGLFARLKPKSRRAASDDAATPVDEKTTSNASAGIESDHDRIVTSEVALDVMADTIYRSTWPYGWFDGRVVDADQWTDQVVTGVTILSRDGVPRSCPPNHPGFAAFEHAITNLNARVAIKLRCKAVDVTVSAIM